MRTLAIHILKHLRGSVWLLALPAATLAHGQTVVRSAAQTDTAPKYMPVKGAIVGLCVDIDRPLE